MNVGSGYMIASQLHINILSDLEHSRLYHDGWVPVDPQTVYATARDISHHAAPDNILRVDIELPESRDPQTLKPTYGDCFLVRRKEFQLLPVVVQATSHK